MKLHFTGRQVQITPAIRSQAEEKLGKIHKIVGRHLDLEAHVILSLERQRYTSEVTLQLKNQALVGVCANHDCYTSLQEALERLETQVIKSRGRWREMKRRPARPPASGKTAAPVEEPAEPERRPVARAAAVAAAARAASVSSD